MALDIQKSGALAHMETSIEVSEIYGMEDPCAWPGRSLFSLTALITKSSCFVEPAFVAPSNLELHAGIHCCNFGPSQVAAKLERRPFVVSGDGIAGNSASSGHIGAVALAAPPLLTPAAPDSAAAHVKLARAQSELANECQEVKAEPSICGDVPELVRCAERGELEKVQALLQAGDDPNQKDHFHLTALHVAAKKGHSHVVSVLLRHGARPNSCAEALQWETPLHYACKYGRESVVYNLLAFKADLGMMTRDGVTPLDLARSKKHRNIEAILVPLVSARQIALLVAEFGWSDSRIAA